MNERTAFGGNKRGEGYLKPWQWLLLREGPRKVRGLRDLWLQGGSREAAPSGSPQGKGACFLLFK